jgi:recombination protein RecR
MDSIHKLQEIFANFPGIGPRQARRFVYYLMNKSPSFLNEFTKLVSEIKKSVFECENCHRFSAVADSHAKQTKCNICSDINRDDTTLLVVARDADLDAIESSGAYKGRYFVLGGSVPILDKEPQRRIRLETLLKHISDSENSNEENSRALKEIIISMNSTPEGDHTADIVRDALRRIKMDLKITVLGRGISTGAELEYLDKDTIQNALQNRH